MRSILGAGRSSQLVYLPTSGSALFLPETQLDHQGIQRYPRRTLPYLSIPTHGPNANRPYTSTPISSTPLTHRPQIPSPTRTAHQHILIPSASIPSPDPPSHRTTPHLRPRRPERSSVAARYEGREGRDDEVMEVLRSQVEDGGSGARGVLWDMGRHGLAAVGS